MMESERWYLHLMSFYLRSVLKGQARSRKWLAASRVAVSLYSHVCWNVRLLLIKCSDIQCTYSLRTYVLDV
jgi:hypothetical protein